MNNGNANLPGNAFAGTPNQGMNRVNFNQFARPMMAANSPHTTGSIQLMPANMTPAMLPPGSVGPRPGMHPANPMVTPNAGHVNPMQLVHNSAQLSRMPQSSMAASTPNVNASTTPTIHLSSPLAAKPGMTMQQHQNNFQVNLNDASAHGMPPTQSALGQVLAAHSPARQASSSKKRASKSKSQVAAHGASTDAVEEIVVDDLDTIKPVELAIARYVRNHEYMADIFSAMPVDAIQIPPAAWATRDLDTVKKENETLAAELQQLQSDHTARLQHQRHLEQEVENLTEQILATDPQSPQWGQIEARFQEAYSERLLPLGAMKPVSLSEPMAMDDAVYTPL